MLDAGGKLSDPKFSFSNQEGEDSAVAEELNLDEEGLCEVLRDDWSLLDGDGCGTKPQLVKFPRRWGTQAPQPAGRPAADAGVWGV